MHEEATNLIVGVLQGLVRMGTELADAVVYMIVYYLGRLFKNK